jgi:hypothetical protein
MRDADPTSQCVVACAESDVDPFHVGGYAARGAQRQDADRRKIILKQPAHGIIIPHAARRCRSFYFACGIVPPFGERTAF